MATGKTYNSVDSKEQLTLVQTGRGKFGGYKQDLLVNKLNELEIEFYVCTQCKGVMRNACQLGEEQIPNCETCVVNKELILPIMKKIRQKILELKANCPLTTRGCQWNATLSEVETHLDVCQEFLVKCDYDCGVILKRCELSNHCIKECLSREVSCEHCLNKTVYRDLKRHYEACLEFPLLCPKSCGANLRRKQTDSHIETDCPNTVVRCHHERFGCKEVIKRCEMNNHCSNECLSREVSCEHCLNKTVYRDLKRHYEACLEFPLLCPNNCGANLRRKQTDSHIETDCPNTVVRCPHERFGCKEVVLRCQMEEHNKTNRIEHLEMTTLFAVAKIEQSEETITKLLKDVNRLTDKLEQSEERNTKQLKEVNRLTDKLEHSEKTNTKLLKEVNRLTDKLEQSDIRMGTLAQRMEDSLSEMEIKIYVCNQCKGVMRNASQLGEEQIPNCENCVVNKESIQPMLKARQKIPELKANCPLTTRGYQWNDTLSDVETDVCQEFVVNCENSYEDILISCEQNNHYSNECLSREISLEHCFNKTEYRDLKRHYEACLEFPLLCPNSCGANLRRKQTDSHIETDCPNTVVRCPHERFGCKEVVKRCQMEEHNKTNKSKHLEMTTLFAVAKIEQSEETNTKLLKDVNRLTDKLEHSEERNTKQLKEVNRLADKLKQSDIRIGRLAQRIEDLEVEKQSPTIDSLTYPVVLRDRIKQSDYIRMRSSAFGILFGNFSRFEITWRDINMILLFGISTRETIPVYINIVSMSRLAKWPFEGRFKLTIIDRVNTKNSPVYESPAVKLQQDPNEFKIATIPRDLLLEDRFRTGKGELEFTLQMQKKLNI